MFFCFELPRTYHPQRKLFQLVHADGLDQGQQVMLVHPVQLGGLDGIGGGDDDPDILKARVVADTGKDVRALILWQV